MPVLQQLKPYMSPQVQDERVPRHTVLDYFSSSPQADPETGKSPIDPDVFRNCYKIAVKAAKQIQLPKRMRQHI